MYKFFVLFGFNLKRMNKSYLFWIFVLVAMLGVPFGIYQFTKDWDTSLLSQVPESYQSAEDLYNVNFFVLFITYFFTVFCGATITNSIANEKISKVSDLLIYHVSPVKIVYSKIFALFALLMEAILVLALECIALCICGLIRTEKILFFLKAMGMDASGIMVIIIMSLIAMFIYTLFYAMVGVCITNQQQMQFAQLPVTIVLIFAFITAYVCLNNPSLALSKAAVYIPFVAPFIMGGGILSGTVTACQVIISAITLIFLIVLCNFFISKVLIPKKMIH